MVMGAERGFAPTSSPPGFSIAIRGLQTPPLTFFL
jgi:hypothetical protein